MKQDTFKYGDYTYKYYLVKEGRKTVSLTVQPSLNIILKCPTNYPASKINTFLKRKWHWMETQLRDLRRYQTNKKPKEHVSGESFLYLGRQYKLVVKKAKKDAVNLDRGRITIHTTQETEQKSYNKKLLDTWYKQRAEQIFNERYREMLKRFSYDFTPALIIRKMDKRWGSFLAKKKVLLNPELIKASKECIDYVIIHELCHMKYQNHSSAYYRFLRSKCPDWEQVKERLELRFL